jgi:hypothetical protein
MSEEIEPNEPPEDDAPGRALVPRFTPGGQPGPGRPKGSSSATTIAMRTAVAAVFEDLQEDHGGERRYSHFFDWAKTNPTEFYRIAARLLPMRVDTGEGAIGVVVFQGIND